MQVTNNADKVHESLNKYKEEIERKLKGMVATFAYKVTNIAVDNTPIGDRESLALGETGKQPFKTYLDLYAGRQKKYGIPIQVGYHKNAWQYSESDNFISLFSPDISDYSYNAESVYNRVQDNYNIGDTFYIGASGPGFAALDGRYESPSSQKAPNGIMAPSVSDIMVIYNSDIKHMFDNA